MVPMDAQTSVIVAVIVVLALLAVAAWFLYRHRQSERLEQRFGPEYDRVVNELGSRDKAEAELMAREKRVSRLRIVSLQADDAEHFAHAWRLLQGRFVDDPRGVVAEADKLVRELMGRRGYPMDDFDHLAADISVDHPAVVSNYRAARDIAVRDSRGESDTEELRRSVVHYRALFDELLEVGPGSAEMSERKRMEARS